MSINAASRKIDPASKHLLLVDDEPNVLKALQRMLRKSGFQIHTASGGTEALECMQQQTIHLVISDMRMPGMDGAQLLGTIAEKWPETIRILLTGFADMDSTIAAINKGHIFQYISKPWDDQELKLAVTRGLQQQQMEMEMQRLTRLTQKQNHQLRELNDSLEQRVAARTNEIQQIADMLDSAYGELKQSYNRTIETFAHFFDLRQSFLKGHGRRVANLSRKMGQMLDLSEGECQEIYFAALLHDIGMIALTDKLIAKPRESLSRAEMQEYERHVTIGESALMSLDPMHHVGTLIRHHHERFDGKGFPDQLSGHDIPLGSRIISICDEFDALLLGHVAHKNFSPTEARRFIQDSSNSRFEPELVSLFLDIPLDDLDPNNIDKLLRTEVRDLHVGMVLGRDIISERGILLLSSGFPLNRDMIEKLQRYEIEQAEHLAVFIQPPDSMEQ